jgi:hypothetical protein
VENPHLPAVPKRWLYAAWLVLIAAFAALHALHLSADFPNHTPWVHDWAKYTDEGWYGNAAIRAHLFGNWYIPGDFNPAPAVPVLPFLEWVLFFFTGVSFSAARGLAVAFFFANLLLTYLLLRTRAPHWAAFLALTLMVTSPFLYCFSRLAILEPLLTTLMLAALNLAVRLRQFRHRIAASIAIGVLFTLMLLTKTTAIFLIPALGWAVLATLWEKSPNRAVSRLWNRRTAGRCAFAVSGAFLLTFGLWMVLVVRLGLLADYKYLFYINNYIKPHNWSWPLVSFWWSFHGSLWVDHILIPLAGVLFAGAVVGVLFLKRNSWMRQLLLDPVYGSSILAMAGYILFMTYQNHPQPRYYAVIAVFSFVSIAMGMDALLSQSGWPRRLGWIAIAACALAAAANGAWTLSYAMHPEYSFITAVHQLADYIDHHPNRNRQLVSISGDEISLETHLPVLCDDFGTPTPTYPDLVTKLAVRQPGWWATWNDIDPGTLEDIHTHFSLEQVASFRAFDDSDRNVLVLFKLHPLLGGRAREIDEQNLQVILPDDKIEIGVQ